MGGMYCPRLKKNIRLNFTCLPLHICRDPIPTHRQNVDAGGISRVLRVKCGTSAAHFRYPEGVTVTTPGNPLPFPQGVSDVVRARLDKAAVVMTNGCALLPMSRHPSASTQLRARIVCPFNRVDESLLQLGVGDSFHVDE